MFSDAAGTVPIAHGATVPSGQKIWMRSTGPSSAVLQATAEATVPSGNVYLYDGNTAGVSDAQQLILAKKATLKTTVQATAEFLPPGSLVVKKTIAGPAAGSQGHVVIHVACDDGVPQAADFIIPAGTPAGTQSRTYDHIAGRNDVHRHRDSQRQRRWHGRGGDRDGQQATIPSGGERDGRKSRTSMTSSRLAARDEDDRRSGCGPARGRSRSTRSAMARP